MLLPGSIIDVAGVAAPFYATEFFSVTVFSVAFVSSALG